jgi:hypothetical protein
MHLRSLATWNRRRILASGRQFDLAGGAQLGLQLGSNRAGIESLQEVRKNRKITQLSDRDPSGNAFDPA